MRRNLYSTFLAGALLFSLASCASDTAAPPSSPVSASSSGENASSLYDGSRQLILSDNGVTLDGKEPDTNTVTVTNDIVYYHDGTDDSYGEGTEADMHTAKESDAHTVVTIREAGTYLVSGQLSAGQLAIDLGEDAKRDPQAVVTLVLDGVDITCTVAPAVIFYNVYECDEAWVAYDEEETEDYVSSPLVDTSAAGANVILADGSVNQVTGSYVARIYKEGTTKKLHKYDGAFYSKMSMNIDGEAEGTGVLTIIADNEGLDSELHLTVNGGSISIQAQNDGINTNEDNVSVTTINGGTLQINAGLGKEGDGIDSNGHIVINGGAIYSMASDHSADGGLDADGDILINGGHVAALGVRNDIVSADSNQLYIEMSFASLLPAGSKVELEGTSLSFTLEKAAQSIIYSAPELKRDTSYTLKVDGVVQQYTGNSSGGFPGGAGGGFPPDDLPEGEFKPDQRPEGGFQPPEDGEFQQPPEDGQQPPTDRPERPEGGWRGGGSAGEPSQDFTLTDDIHAFSGITAQE